MQRFELVWDNQHLSTANTNVWTGQITSNNSFRKRRFNYNSLDELVEGLIQIFALYQRTYSRERRSPQNRPTKRNNGVPFAMQKNVDIPVGYIQIKEIISFPSQGRSAEIIINFSQLGPSFRYRSYDPALGTGSGPNGFGEQLEGPYDRAGAFINVIRRLFTRAAPVPLPAPAPLPEPTPLPTPPEGFRYGRRRSTTPPLLPINPPPEEIVAPETTITNESIVMPNEAVYTPTWGNTFRGYRNAATRAATSAVSGATGAVSGLFGRFFSGAPESTTESTLVSLPPSTSTRRRRSTNYTASQTRGGKRTKRNRRRHTRRRR